MLGGIIQAGTRALGGSRFSLVNLMPTAFFVAFMAALITSGAYTRPKPSLTPILDIISKDPGVAVAATLGIFLLAVLLRPFQVAIVQILEGYSRRWRPLEFVNDVAAERHRRTRNTTAIMLRAESPNQPSAASFRDVAYYARQLHAFHRMRARASATVERYPVIQGSDSSGDDRMMPTLLGNVLRAGEDDAGHRYGLDMPVVYPRMYPSLSPKLDRAISAQLDMLDTTSALCVVFGLISLFALPLTTRLNWWSLVPLVAMFMSLLAYRGAVATARGHGRLLATAFDLHRFDMLTALHHKLPSTPREELELNRELSAFLGGRDPSSVLYMEGFPYSHPPTAADGGGQ
jgi:hypothetical protein